MIAAIDTGALLQLVWVAPLSVLAITVLFATLVHGATRAADARREHRGALAVALNGAMALIGAVAFAAAIVFGLIILLGSK